MTKRVPKYQLIKTHTARRSFCTNAYKAGMDCLDIMALSGHTTEKSFLRYIKVTQEERQDCGAWFFNQLNIDWSKGITKDDSSDQGE